MAKDEARRAVVAGKHFLAGEQHPAGADSDVESLALVFVDFERQREILALVLRIELWRLDEVWPHLLLEQLFKALHHFLVRDVLDGVQD